MTKKWCEAKGSKKPKKYSYTFITQEGRITVRHLTHSQSTKIANKIKNLKIYGLTKNIRLLTGISTSKKKKTKKR